MVLIKISDSELEKIKCHCGHYLSKPPIYIQNGQNICGNCVDLLAPVPLKASRNTSLETLAGYFSFPCRYKPQGCPLDIKFHDDSNHEAFCCYRIYSCPFNEDSSCDWQGIVSQLHQHYKRQHPELCPISSNTKVRVNEDYEEYRVVITDDLPFLLYTKCETQKDKLCFNIICFTTATDAGLINCTIKLSNKTATNTSLTLDGEPLPFSGMGSKPRLCVKISSIRDILQSGESVDCSWIINVTEEIGTELKQRLDEKKLAAYEAQKEITKCLDCGIYTVPPIKRCGKGHVICTDCRGYYDHCKICKEYKIEFQAATELEEIAKNGLFECKWPNCNAFFFSKKIRNHERVCSKRIYTCPECNRWSGQHDQIESHFTSVHKDIRFNGSEVSCFTVYDHNMIIYFFACSEFFKLINDKYNPTLHYCGSPSFVDMWEFNVGFAYRGRDITATFSRGDYNKYLYSSFDRYTNYKITIKLKTN